MGNNRMHDKEQRQAATNKELFVAVNEMGMRAFGDANWAAIVSAAKTHAENSGILLNGDRDFMVLSLGLYLGTSYGMLFTKNAPPVHEQKPPEV